MKLCINPATTMKTDYRTDIEAYAAAGFKAMEIWLGKVDEFLKTNSLKDARAVLDDNGLKAADSCAVYDIMLPTNKKKVFDNFKRQLEITVALGASVVAVVTDRPQKVTPTSYDRAITNLRKAADIAKAYKVKLAVEFISRTKLLGSLRTTRKLIHRVGRSNVGILFDTFHFYTGVSQMPDILETKGKEIFFVHINDCTDVPRELAEDANRVLLGRGVFPLKEIIRSLKKIGYNGYYSLELFNEELWAQDSKAVARKAYRNLQSYLSQV